MRHLTSVLLILTVHFVCNAQSKAVDFDITAADGAKLRATYYSADKPGPGILLLHQCASCGVENAVQLARRTDEIKALLLLTGPTTPPGREFLKTHPNLALFWTDSPEMGYKAIVQTSTNPATTTRDVNTDWHGVVMFERDASILSAMADWVARVLR